MNDREIAILQSWTKVVDLCTRKSDDFAGLPTFNQEVTTLAGLLSSIRSQNQVLEVSTKGYTEAKNAAKEGLIAVLMPVLKRVQAYASISKDEVLKNEVKLSSSELAKMYESMLASTCRAVKQVCEAKSAVLAPYGLTEPMLRSLDDAITAFEAKLAGSPQYRGEQKAAKLTIEMYFGQGDDIIKNKLDMLAEIIKDTNPETYTEYRNARKLEMSGSRTLALKFKVHEAGSQTPVNRVKLTLTKVETEESKKKGGGSDLAKNVKFTSPLGGCQVKSLEAGSYSITATKEGFLPQTVTVFVNDGETSEVKIEMGRM